MYQAFLIIEKEEYNLRNVCQLNKVVPKHFTGRSAE